DWSTAPNVLMGMAVMGTALSQMGWPITLLQVVAFGLLFICATALAYSFLLLLTSSAVLLVRNQNLMGMWWLFTSLMRYTCEIFLKVGWAEPVGLFFTFIVPVMLVISVPAQIMVKILEPHLAAFTIVATAVMLFVSRKFFRYALRRYRSASS